MDHLQLKQQLACVYPQCCHELHTAVIAERAKQQDDILNPTNGQLQELNTETGVSEPGDPYAFHVFYFL